MFTLDDFDVRDVLAVLQVTHAGSGVTHPTPEADARLHPSDYFIAA